MTEIKVNDYKRIDDYRAIVEIAGDMSEIDFALTAIADPRIKKVEATGMKEKEFVIEYYEKQE